MMMQQQRMMGGGGGWPGAMQQRMFPGYNQQQRYGNNTGGGGGESNRGPSDANLFLYGIPDVWADQDLLQLCTPFGMVLSASVYRDRETGTSKGFGFVSYDNALSAQNAIMALNGLAIGNKRLKVELKAQRNNTSNYRGGGGQQFGQQQGQQANGSLLLDPMKGQPGAGGQFGQAQQPPHPYQQQQYNGQFGQPQAAGQQPGQFQQQGQLYGQQGQQGQGQQAQGHTLFP